MEPNLVRLEHLVADNAAQTARVQELRALVSQWRASATPEEEAGLQTSSYADRKRLMDTIRLKTDELLQVERQLRDVRSGVVVQRTHHLQGGVLAAFLALGTAGGLSVYRRIRRIADRYENLLRARDAQAASLRDSETRYRTTFANAAVGIAHVALDGRWLHCNDAVCTITGYERAELLTKTFADITHPADAKEDWANIRRLMAGEVTTYSREKRYIKKHGETVWIHLTVSLLRDETGTPQYFLGIIQDISERKRAEAALRQSQSALIRSEESLRLALDAARLGWWDWNFETNALIWDETCKRMFGLPSEEAVSYESFVAAVHPDDRARVQAAINRTLRDRTDYDIELRIRWPDGTVRWINSKGAAWHNAAGRPIRMSGVALDITARKEMEAQLHEWNQELEQRVRIRTQELERSKDRLRSLATELNLAEQRERRRMAIELHDHLQQMLVLGTLKTGQAKALVSQQPSIAALWDQVDEVLKGALQYTRTLVADLSPPVLREHGLGPALKWLSGYMEKRDVRVIVSVPDQSLDIPESEAVLLFQSVRELLINVSKHAAGSEAWVTMERMDGQLTIEVKDHGPGFHIDALTSAPEEDGISSKFGLFSIRERMQALGGSFFIKSRLGEGTTATLTLPLQLAVSRSLPAESTAQGSEESVPLDGSKASHSSGTIVPVLLVDDHAMVRQGLRSVLESYQDMTIIGEASDGQEAIQKVNALHPLVVVMDLNMPIMNGIEATRHMKVQHPEIIVIGLSVNAGAQEQAAMKKAGAAVLLTKEAAVDELYATIKTMVLKAADTGP